MLVRYASLHRTLDLLTCNAVAELPAERGQPGRRVGLFNPLPFARRRLVTSEAGEPAVVELDGFEARTIELLPARPDGAARAGDRIESDRISVQTGAGGTLKIEDLSRGRRLEGLHALEHEPDMGDLYNFCPIDAATEWSCTGASTRVLSDGPAFWELELTYHGELPAGLGPELQPREERV